MPQKKLQIPRICKVEGIITFPDRITGRSHFDGWKFRGFTHVLKAMEMGDSPIGRGKNIERQVLNDAEWF